MDVISAFVIFAFCCAGCATIAHGIGHKAGREVGQLEMVQDMVDAGFLEIKKDD